MSADGNAPVRREPGAVAQTVEREGSERRRVEAELRHSRDQLELILSGISDAISVQNLDGGLVYANDAAVRLGGFASAEELQRTTIAEIISRFEVWNEDGTPVDPARLPGQRALAGELNEQTLRFRDRKSGRERWSVVRGVPVFDDSGAVRMSINVFRDITEERRLEGEATAARWRLEHLYRVTRALQEAPLDGANRIQRLAELQVPELADWCAVFSRREDGTLELAGISHADAARVEWARDLYRRFPLDPGLPTGLPAVIRTGVPELMPQIPDALLEEAAGDSEYVQILRALGLRSYMGVPMRVRGRSFGAIAFMSARADRIYGDEDLAMACELGDRAAQAMENARLYEESQNAVRTREDLLAFASHDLRNPLGTIALAVEVLARALPSEEVRKRKAAENVRRSIDRMQRLISDLLDLARLEGGGIALQRGTVEAAALVAESFDAMGSLAAERGVHLESAVSAGPVSCDRERALQVLMNLIGNAIKFSPSGTTVRVSAALDGEWVRFAIVDAGPGIPDEQLKRIFQRFVQADRRDARGVGLGLAIAQGLVESHGGRIGVESAPGQGSIFWFTLPRA